MKINYSMIKAAYREIDTILRSIRNVASKIDTILRSIRNVASKIDTILRSIRNVASKIVIYFTIHMVYIMCLAITS